MCLSTFNFQFSILNSVNHLLSAKGKLIASALTLFGMGGCQEPPVCEYGCPYAEFHIHGTVTDEHSHPLGGIAVNAGYGSDTTKADGKYNILTDGTGRGDAPRELHLTDIDGDRTPSYPDTTVALSWEGIEPEGASGRWDEGTFTLQKDVQMKR